jgi:hypothetical protein
VLLVYHAGQPPVSIMIHSFQEITWLYLIDTPEQPVDQNLDLMIREILTKPVLYKVQTENDSLIIK